jgi:hypothetical protein
VTPRYCRADGDNVPHTAARLKRCGFASADLLIAEATRTTGTPRPRLSRNLERDQIQAWKVTVHCTQDGLIYQIHRAGDFRRGRPSPWSPSGPQGWRVLLRGREMNAYSVPHPGDLRSRRDCDL